MKLTLWEAVCMKGEGFGGDFDPASLFGGQGGGGGGFGQIPDVGGMFPGVPVPQNGVAGGNMAPYMSSPTPAPGQGGGWGGQGLQPWNYEVPNPQLPKPPKQHADFENFPGGKRPGGGRRGRGNRRRQRRRDQYFDNFGSGTPQEKFPQR